MPEHPPERVTGVMSVAHLRAKASAAEPRRSKWKKSFSRELGFARLIRVHRQLEITDEQRARFVELYMEALDESELPKDQGFREAVRSHVEFGTGVAQQNSHAKTDAELHPLRELPQWDWPGDRDDGDRQDRDPD